MQHDQEAPAQYGWIDALNERVLVHFNTRLVGGYTEPFYKAATKHEDAELRFTRDYVRSALHELAHWCVAGRERRQQDDYGYWYEPDGRSEAQQRLFFQAEIRPQAIEKHFCDALGIPFSVSVDNLGTAPLAGVEDFSRAVEQCHADYALHGLPARASRIRDYLLQWKYQATKPGSQLK